MFLVDLTDYINWFLSAIFDDILPTIISILNSFTFYGFSLLTFILAVGLIAVGISVVVAVTFPSKRSPYNAKGSYDSNKNLNH